MKSIEEINNYMLSKQMLKLSISKTPTWVDGSKKEGVELQNGKLISFWVVNGERVYSQPESNHITNILKDINIDSVSKQGEKNNSVTVYCPDVLTSDLLAKWQKMTSLERLLLFQNTPSDMVKTKPKGSRKVSYVEGNLMQQEANIAFLFVWSDFITDKYSDDNGCSVFGGVSAIINGEKITHTAIGIDLQEFSRADNKPIFSTHELFKNAHTDMIKKALSKFGFNGDVYRGEV